MKTFFVVLALIVAAVAAEDWQPKKFEDFKVIREECLALNPLSHEIIESFKKMIYPDEEAVRKHILCFSKKLGIWSEEKGFLLDRIVKQFKMSTDETEATVIVKKCFEMNEPNMSADVMMYNGYMCLLNSKLGVEIKERVMAGKKA